MLQYCHCLKVQFTKVIFLLIVQNAKFKRSPIIWIALLASDCDYEKICCFVLAMQLSKIIVLVYMSDYEFQGNLLNTTVDQRMLSNWIVVGIDLVKFQVLPIRVHVREQGSSTPIGFAIGSV